MKMRTWMAALVMGCAGMTVEAQTPATDVDVATVLGHNLGDKFTRHHQVVDVMTHLAEARPHWQLENYGTTTEGRPLLGLIMSSEENMANLDALREANRRRVAEGVDSGDRVVWVYLSYNVHGNEAVCTEAAMATAEALATTHSHLLENGRWWSWTPVSTRTAETGMCISKTSPPLPVPTPTRTLGNTTSRGLAVDPTTTCLT